MHSHARRKRNTHGIQTVTLTRGRSGYGFTISGEKPCRLGAIVQGSSADRAGLQNGDRVISIDGHNVSGSTHDDVVRRIGQSKGLLTLAVADRSSDSSSDDDSSDCELDLGGQSGENGIIKQVRCSPVGECNSANSAKSVWQKVNGSSKYAKIQGHGVVEYLFGQMQNSDKHGRQTAFRKTNTLTTDHHQSGSKRADSEVIHRRVKHTLITREARLGLDNVRQTEELCHQRSSPDGSTCSCHDESVLSCEDFQVIVSYSGSVEMPSDAPRLAGLRLQSIKAAVQRLRATRSNRSLVLMDIDADGIRLVDHSHHALAHYVTDRIAFCGICPDDRRFFGIVMTQNEKENIQSTCSGSSCHVFMVDPDLSDHRVHASTAARFGVNCTMDLDTDCCLEFPKSATPIIRYLGQLYRQRKSGCGFFAPVLNETKLSNKCNGLTGNSRACVIDVANPNAMGGSLEQSFIHDLSVIHPTYDHIDEVASWKPHKGECCFADQLRQNAAENSVPHTLERPNVQALHNTRDVTLGLKHSSVVRDDVINVDSLHRSVQRILSADRQRWPSKQSSSNDVKSGSSAKSYVKTGSAVHTAKQPPPLPPRQALSRSDSDRASARVGNIQITHSGTKMSSVGILKTDASAFTEMLVHSASKPPLPERRAVVSRTGHKNIAPVPKREPTDRPKSTPPTGISNELHAVSAVDCVDYDSDPGEQLHEGQNDVEAQVKCGILKS
jgi:hypothetical protein